MAEARPGWILRSHAAIPPFEVAHPTSVEAAVAAGSAPGSAYFAGGIDQIRYVDKIDWQRVTLVRAAADIVTRSAGQTLVAVIARDEKRSPDEVRKTLILSIRSAMAENPSPAGETLSKGVPEVFSKSMAVKLTARPSS